MAMNLQEMMQRLSANGQQADPQVRLKFLDEVVTVCEKYRRQWPNISTEDARFLISLTRDIFEEHACLSERFEKLEAFARMKGGSQEDHMAAVEKNLDLHNQLDALREENAKLVEESGYLNRSYGELRGRLDEMETELFTFPKKIAELTEERDGLQNMVEALNDKITILENES